MPVLPVEGGYRQMRNLSEVEADIKRTEEDVEIDIEFSLDHKEITKKEYLNLICLIRIARALNKLAYKD